MIKKQHQDDWSSDESLAKPDVLEKIRYDDIVHAYRWILGREPESSDVIQSHLNRSYISKEHMRRQFLSSPEFIKRWKSISGAGELISLHLDESPFTRSTKPIVFFHIPKTGGSTVNYHLEQAFSDEERCGVRHNNILTTTIPMIINKKLFSGHFDNRILHIIPDNATCLTILRDPKERLFSIYKYFNSFSIEKILLNNFTLAKIAVENDFTNFLKHASKLNPGAIDNCYMRTFSMTLPINRWETEAENNWANQFTLLSDKQLNKYCNQAISLLEERFNVYFFETFEKSFHEVMKIAGVSEISEIKHFKNLENLPDKELEKLRQKKLKFEESPILDRLTMFDQKIYSHFKSINECSPQLSKKHEGK